MFLELRKKADSRTYPTLNIKYFPWVIFSDSTLAITGFLDISIYFDILIHMVREIWRM